MTILDVIYQFQGVFGAVFGTVATLIITQLLRNIGKIYFYGFYEIKKSVDDGYGRHCEVDCFAVSDNQKQFEYKMMIQVYNSSESMKMIKDVCIEFETIKGVIKHKPLDNATAIQRSHWTDREELTFVNIPAKELVELDIVGWIYSEECPNIYWLNDIESVYISFRDYKNKYRRVRISMNSWEFLGVLFLCL